MVANARARAIQVFIGADLQDWSDAAVSLATGYESLPDTGGMVKVTATLVLANIVGAPESISPRANPIRWKPGQDVYIRVRNDANDAWIDTLFSRLKIIREPAEPLRDEQQISLDLGCKLRWADLFELDDDGSGVVFGTPETCDLIASRLLQASEVDAGDISLSTWPYSLAYPFGKDTNSFAEQAGQLAWSNNGRILYQNVAGDVTQRVLSFASGTPVATVTLGDDDIVWQPLQDPQQPPETTKAAGSGYEQTQQTTPVVTVDSTTGNFGDYTPGGAGTGIVSRRTTTNSYVIGNATTNSTKTTRVETDELEVTIFQNPGIPTQLVEFEEYLTVETYEQNADPSKAKLLNIVETLERREKAIIPDGVFANMREIYRKTTTFTYGANEAAATVSVVEREAEIIHDEASASPWTLQTTNASLNTYTEVAPGIYQLKEVTQTARIVENSNVDKADANIWALTTRTQNHPAGRDNAPPATQFFDLAITEQEYHYEGTASYVHPGGSTGRNRQRLYTIPFGFSNAQMATLAALHRDLLKGRHYGDEIELTISDDLLVAPPLAQIDVVDGATTYEYLADALKFSFEPNQATAHCVGIRIIPEAVPTLLTNNESLPALQDSPVATAATLLTNAESLPAIQDNPTATAATALTNNELLPAIEDAPVAADVTALTNDESLPALQDAPVASRDADALAHLARLTGTYSGAELEAIETAFAQLKVNNLYSKIATFVCLAMDNSTDALLNWISTGYTATNGGAMVFTARQGFTGNGSSTSFLNTGYIPSAGITAQNNSAVHFYVRTGVDGAFNDYGGRSGLGANAVYIRTRTTGTALTTINSNTIPAGILSSGITGLHSVSRTASTGEALYRNGVSQGSKSATSTGQPTVAEYVGAFNNGGTAIDATSKQYAFYARTQGMNATEIAAFNTIVTDLLTAFGANV